MRRELMMLALVGAIAPAAYGAERELCADRHEVQATYNIYRASECLRYTDDLERKRKLHVIKQWAVAELVSALADKPQGADLAKMIVEAPDALGRMFLMSPLDGVTISNKDEMFKSRGCGDLPRCVASEVDPPADQRAAPPVKRRRVNPDGGQ